MSLFHLSPHKGGLHLLQLTKVTHRENNIKKQTKCLLFCYLYFIILCLRIDMNRIVISIGMKNRIRKATL